jgi:hypothetical protein
MQILSLNLSGDMKNKGTIFYLIFNCPDDESTIAHKENASLFQNSSLL